MSYLNERGETLVETLASIVVCTFAFIMLMTAVAVATNINTTAYNREVDLQRQHVPSERHVNQSEESDLLNDDAKTDIKFGGQAYTVKLYGGNDLCSYEFIPSESEG